MRAKKTWHLIDEEKLATVRVSGNMAEEYVDRTLEHFPTMTLVSRAKWREARKRFAEKRTAIEIKMNALPEKDG